MNFQKIIVAIDDSELTQSVFDQALNLAKVSRGSLMLLHCLSSDPLGEPMVPLNTDLGLYPEMMFNSIEIRQAAAENQFVRGREILDRYSQIAIDQGVPTVVEELVGEAGECLCQTAKKWGSDLIVLGRRGRSGLAEALLGSVSNYVLHHAPCSILVVHNDLT